MREAFCRMLALVASALCVAAAQPIEYPPTAKVEHIDRYFGTPIADPYHWLEDDNSAQTRAWVEAQNALTFKVLYRIAFRTSVRERIRTLANYPRYSAPFQKNGNIFFYKNDGLQN